MRNIHRRFGTIAVQKGFISIDQLTEALGIQAREDIEKGEHRLVGQILLDLGYITEAQIDDVLEILSYSMLFAIGGGR